MSSQNLKFESLVIHGGQTTEEWKKSTLAPIYQSASNRFETAEELSEVFGGKKPGYIYQRLRNPTNHALEKRLTLLEWRRSTILSSLFVKQGMRLFPEILYLCRPIYCLLMYIKNSVLQLRWSKAVI